MGFVNNAANSVSSALGTDSQDSGLGRIGSELFRNPLVSGAATIAGGVLGGPGGAALVNGIASRSQGHDWGQVAANAAGAGLGAYGAGLAADALGGSGGMFDFSPTAGGVVDGITAGGLTTAARTALTAGGLLAAGGGGASGGGGGGGATGAYTDAATAQGTANRDAANFNTNLNRANQTGPGGSLTWSQDPVTGRWTQATTLDTANQNIFNTRQATGQNFANAAQAVSAGLANQYGQPMSTSGLGAIQSVTGGQNTAAQAQAAQGTAAQSQAAGYGGTAPMEAAKAQAALAGPAASFSAAQAGPAAQATAGNAVYDSTIRDRFDTSGVRALPGQIDDTSRQRVEEALLSRLNPQYANDEQALRTRLLNSGIEVGTDAYNKEMANFSQRLNDARMQAILAGGQEENRQVGLTQGLNAQEFGQALSQGQFGQSADVQTASNKLQTSLANAQMQQQASLANAQMQNQMAIANLNNQQQAGMFNAGNQQQSSLFNAGNQQATNLANAGYGQQANLANTANAQQTGLFNAGNQQQTNLTNAANQQQMGLANLGNQQQTNLANTAATNAQNQANFQNQLNSVITNNAGQQQGFNQAQTLYNQPLAAALALQGGAQVQMPNFGSYYTGGSAAANPVLDATIAQGNYNLGQATQNQSGQNALLNGLVNLGSAWINS